MADDPKRTMTQEQFEEAFRVFWRLHHPDERRSIKVQIPFDAWKAAGLPMPGED